MKGLLIFFSLLNFSIISGCSHYNIYKPYHFRNPSSEQLNFKITYNLFSKSELLELFSNTNKIESALVDFNNSISFRKLRLSILALEDTFPEIKKKYITFLESTFQLEKISDNLWDDFEMDSRYRYLTFRHLVMSEYFEMVGPKNATKYFKKYIRKHEKMSLRSETNYKRVLMWDLRISDYKAIASTYKYMELVDDAANGKPAGLSILTRATNKRKFFDAHYAYFFNDSNIENLIKTVPFFTNNEQLTRFLDLNQFGAVEGSKFISLLDKILENADKDKSGYDQLIAEIKFQYNSLNQKLFYRDFRDTPQFSKIEKWVFRKMIEIEGTDFMEIWNKSGDYSEELKREHVKIKYKSFLEFFKSNANKDLLLDPKYKKEMYFSTVPVLHLFNEMRSYNLPITLSDNELLDIFQKNNLIHILDSMDHFKFDSVSNPFLKYVVDNYDKFPNTENEYWQRVRIIKLFHPLLIEEIKKKNFSLIEKIAKNSALDIRIEIAISVLEAQDDIDQKSFNAILSHIREIDTTGVLFTKQGKIRKAYLTTKKRDLIYALAAFRSFENNRNGCNVYLNKIFNFDVH